MYKIDASSVLHVVNFSKHASDIERSPYMQMHAKK